MAKVPVKAFLSRSEVARLFHVSPITVGRWAEQGKLPYERTLGGQRRYPREGTLAILGDVTRRGQQATPRQRPRRTGTRAFPGSAADSRGQDMDRMGEVKGSGRPRLARSGVAPGAAHEGGHRR